MAKMQACVATECIGIGVLILPTFNLCSLLSLMATITNAQRTSPVPTNQSVQSTAKVVPRGSVRPTCYPTVEGNSTSTCIDSVQLSFSNMWGTLCHVYPEGGWNFAAADVICHQMCFSGALNISHLTVSLLDLSKRRKPHVWLASFSCHGKERNITECQDYDLSSVPYLTTSLYGFCQIPIINCQNKSYSPCWQSPSRRSRINLALISALTSASSFVFFTCLFVIIGCVCKRKQPQCQGNTGRNNRLSPEGEECREQLGRNRNRSNGTHMQRNCLTSLHELNSINSSMNTQETSIAVSNSQPNNLPMVHAHEQPLPNGRTPSPGVVGVTPCVSKPPVSFSTASRDSADLIVESTL